MHEHASDACIIKVLVAPARSSLSCGDWPPGIAAAYQQGRATSGVGVMLRIALFVRTRRVTQTVIGVPCKPVLATEP